MEIQEHVQSGMDWRWIQLSQNWIWVWGVNDIYDVIGWWWYWNEFMNNDERNGNNIGDSGACSIGDGLKVNSTLTKLSLWEWGVNDIYDTIGWLYWYELMNDNERNGNNIGESGGCSIGDGLKVNSTLTKFDLRMRN